MEGSIFRVPTAFDQAALFRSLHIEQEPETDEYDAVIDLMTQARALAKPKAYYKESRVTLTEQSVLLDSLPFPYPLVWEKLASLQVVYPYVITCGQELEAWSRFFTDPLESYIADGIKLYVLGQIGSAFHQHIKETYFPACTFSALTPGSIDAWPIRGQRELFDLLGDCKEKIGVELTRDYLIVPTKSGSGIYFESEGEFHSCDRCPRQNCPNRRSRYVGSSADKN